MRTQGWNDHFLPPPHERNGDYVLNMVLDEIAKNGHQGPDGQRKLCFDVHEPIIGHIKTALSPASSATTWAARSAKPSPKESWTNRSSSAATAAELPTWKRGTSVIDVAFIAAPTADDMGNCTGKAGQTACGSIGYAFCRWNECEKVVVITDNLVE